VEEDEDLVVWGFAGDGDDEGDWATAGAATKTASTTSEAARIRILIGSSLPS
jgi:hypothetical protein